MPNSWVDYLWKTRWCPMLANCQDFVTGGAWCFGAHEESELRCPQFALTSVLPEKYAKEIASGEIKIDEKYGACPRGAECPFCHTSGTAKEQKGKFFRDDEENERKKKEDKNNNESASSSAATSPTTTKKNETAPENNDQQQCDVNNKNNNNEKFVEPAIPEALLSQFRILKSAERRRLFYKTSLCPLLAPLCEDCVHKRCFFASSLEELRCPYFSLYGICPRRRCEWLHCTHEALGTCRTPVVVSSKNEQKSNFPSDDSTSPTSTTLVSTVDNYNNNFLRLDPPDQLWLPTPQTTPQITGKKTKNENNADNENDDDDDEEEAVPDLKL
jgi:hypothetical protein